MRILLLNGHGINFKVDSAKLIITNGRFSDKEPEQYVFKPKKIDYDNIVVYGQNGNISIDAIRWLTKHNVQITILNWDGKILTTMLPPESVEVKTKFNQYKAYEDQEKRIKIAKQILKAKFERTQEVLNYLKERYPHIDTDFSKELSFFKEANTIKDLMMMEGRIARHYWTQIRLITPNKYDFEGRHTQNHPRASGDMINTMLNYAYSLLEAECLRAINSTGLDAHIGFLHEQCMGKNSLAYDLQELYRYLIDLTIIDLLEKNTMKKSDFIRTENYNLKLKPNGTKK